MMPIWAAIIACMITYWVGWFSHHVVMQNMHRHDWSKWNSGTATLYRPFGGQVPDAPIQRRVCRSCGQEELRY